jgi:VWFA-related protein
MQANIDACRIGMLFACLMSGVVLGAQQPAAIHSENGVYTLHEDTHLVLLDVTVADKPGHPVTGLTKDDFKLLEDGQPQTIKFFEEHAPVDPAEIARQKAAAMAGRPPNTFTNFELFTGRPVTVLLLNELFPVPKKPLVPVQWLALHQAMLQRVQSAPPDTPFAVYVLSAELRLVQPVTTDRALLLAKIDEIWKDPDFGSEKLINPQEYAASLLTPSKIGYKLPPVEDVPVRRRIMTTAIQQLAAGLKDTPGRKDLFVIGGAFQCSVVASGGGHDVPPCPAYTAIEHGKEFLCRLEDTLEQGRIWLYRDYGEGGVAYGFGCGSTGANVRDLSHYYTLYYTPTNGDWNGKYRATTVEVADKGLHLAYRKGYYGTPENAETHYYTANGPAAAPATAKSGGLTIAATVVAAGTAGSESLDTAAHTAPSPAALVFSVQMIPADATVVAASADDKKKQEYRELTLRFTMPASELKVVQSGAGLYVARLEIGAVSYADGRSLETYGSQLAVNFNGAADPRIANSTITAKLTLNVPEHGHNRWLYVSIRDVATGQSGDMVIPMEQVKMPGTQ